MTLAFIPSRGAPGIRTLELFCKNGSLRFVLNDEHADAGMDVSCVIGNGRQGVSAEMTLAQMELLGEAVAITIAAMKEANGA